MYINQTEKSDILEFPGDLKETSAGLSE